MADTDVTTIDLVSAAGAVGTHTTEAFALLGDETRLAILLALWDATDPPVDHDGTVPFSRIFDAVDYDDPGNLRYHLEKLEGQFITHDTDGGGYKLRVPGMKLVRSVIAGAGVEDACLEPTEIDQDCPFCDAPTEISYRDGLVIWNCTECGGASPGHTETAGLLTAAPFEPAGLADRSAEDLRAASVVGSWRQSQMLFDGICWTCSGPIEAWLRYCSDHDPEGVCDACGSKAVAWAGFKCRVCKNYAASTPKALAMSHPAVIALYDNHGVSLRVQATDLESVKRAYRYMHEHELDLVSEDPPLLAVTASIDGDSVRLVFDETVSVVDVQR